MRLDVSHNDNGGLTVDGDGTLIVKFSSDTYAHIHLGSGDVVYNSPQVNGEGFNIHRDLTRKAKTAYKFELGQEVRDQLTGVTGNVTGRADYLTGCNQYSVTPRSCEGNKVPDSHWFDEGRLVLTNQTANSVDPKDYQVEGNPGCDIAPPSKG